MFPNCTIFFTTAKQFDWRPSRTPLAGKCPAKVYEVSKRHDPVQGSVLQPQGKEIFHSYTVSTYLQYKRSHLLESASTWHSINSSLQQAQALNKVLREEDPLGDKPDGIAA